VYVRLHCSVAAALVASISAALMNLLSALIQDVKSTPPIKDYVSNIPNIILDVLNSVNTTLFYDTGTFTQQIHATQQLFWMRLRSHLSSIGMLGAVRVELTVLNAH
jgi:hypothetical protein